MQKRTSSTLISTVDLVGVPDSKQAGHARPLALRATLLELHKLRLASAGRSEKMELVYNYICSAQFAQRVRSVVEGFEELRCDLQKERDGMTRIWKKREAQVPRMTTGMLSMVGDLQAIGQGAAEGQLDAIAVLPAVDAEVWAA